MTAKIGLILGLFFALGCTKHAEESEEPVQVAGPGLLKISSDAMSNLKIANAQMMDYPDTLSVTGKISPTEDRTNVIPARAAGRIEQILIASGESVTAGQPLALLWSPDYVSAREEFIQSVRKGNAMAGESDFKTLAVLARKKLETMGLSPKDIQALTEVADSGGDSDKVDKADKAEKYLVVRAPRSGAVVAKNAVLGNMVNQGEPLFMIADLHQVWFLGDMYPEDLIKVKKDQKVIIDGAVGGQQLEGKVSFISPIVDPNSRTIKIRAMMNNPSLALRGDMYVQGNLVLADRRAIMVPSRAILREQDASYVFKVSTPKSVEGHGLGIEAQKTKVSVLGERQGLVAIGEGVTDGDQVVSDGTLLLNAALTNNGK